MKALVRHEEGHKDIAVEGAGRYNEPFERWSREAHVQIWSTKRTKSVSKFYG